MFTTKKLNSVALIFRKINIFIPSIVVNQIGFSATSVLKSLLKNKGIYEAWANFFIDYGNRERIKFSRKIL